LVKVKKRGAFELGTSVRVERGEGGTERLRRRRKNVGERSTGGKTGLVGAKLCEKRAVEPPTVLIFAARRGIITTARRFERRSLPFVSDDARRQKQKKCQETALFIDFAEKKQGKN